MKAPEMRTVQAMDDIDSFDDGVQRKLVMLRQVLGDEVTVERIKYFLHGANGDEEVALNHILNDVEKGRKTKLRGRETEKPTTVETGNTSTPPNPPLPASTDKILYELAEEVKCPLCLSYFNKPVILACFHTFCSPCIEDIVTGDSCFDCPLCRTKIQLNERGVNGLKANHYLANIVEKLRGAQNTKMCDECQRTLCTVVCKNCKAFLCNGCNDKIHAIRLMNSHHRVPFEECFFTSSRSSSFSALDLSDTVKWESDLVIPFNVKKEVCTDLFYSWAKELWFAPGDFLKSAILKEFKMVYVPYWVFEVDTQSRYVVSYADKLFGETNETGSIGARHVDLLVCASSCNEAPLLEQIEPWKIDQTTAFTLKHAEGAEVRPFTMDADSCWRMKAKATVEQNCKDSCRRKQRSNVRSDNVTKINVDTTYSNRNSRRLFLPIYSTTFEYKSKKYLFVVNGSTAKAFGNRPYSTGKLASLSFTGFGAAVGFLTGTRLSPP